MIFFPGHHLSKSAWVGSDLSREREAKGHSMPKGPGQHVLVLYSTLLCWFLSCLCFIALYGMQK